MEFDLKTTAGAFTLVLALVIVGTVMSPMTASTVTMVNVGLAVFGVIALVLGIKHGEYRASGR